MVIYRILADSVMWFHWFWIALMLGGIFFSINHPWYVPFHGLIIATTITGQILFLGCPLVALESALRRKYDPSVSYTGSFTCHYLNEWFGIVVSPQVMVVILLVISLIYLAIMIAHHIRR
ncbi:MAG: DUF2784 domain-containing protein [Candidatus Moranbacteria bacterium]|nr:DUF2784 domain-containing protein [Candidatus Moranbacteria bacterium]